MVLEHQPDRPAVQRSAWDGVPAGSSSYAARGSSADIQGRDGVTDRVRYRFRSLWAPADVLCGDRSRRAIEAAQHLLLEGKFSTQRVDRALKSNKGHRQPCGRNSRMAGHCAATGLGRITRLMFAFATRMSPAAAVERRVYSQPAVVLMTSVLMTSCQAVAMCCGGMRLRSDCGMSHGRAGRYPSRIRQENGEGGKENHDWPESSDHSLSRNTKDAPIAKAHLSLPHRPSASKPAEKIEGER